MNRPAPISVFSDQYRTKSTTRSRTSCGTHTLVRAPQDFFLKRCARPSIRPAPRPWFGSSFPETRSVVVPLDGPAGSCPGRQLRHSRRTLSANGRTPWAAVHAPHRDQKPALYPTSAASGWQPSPLKCSAFALFACRPLRYLNGRTLSPLPAEARHVSIPCPCNRRSVRRLIEVRTGIPTSEWTPPPPQTRNGLVKRANREKLVLARMSEQMRLPTFRYQSVFTKQEVLHVLL